MSESDVLSHNMQDFVARTPALARLDGALARARAGQGTFLFVTGSTGTGKSALLQNFLVQATAHDADLVTALGPCDAYTGMGDAYLPLREALSQLMGLTQGPTQGGGREEAWWRGLAVDTCQILVELGPDLLDIFVPFGDIVGKLGSAAVKRTDWYQELESMRGKGKAAGGIDQAQIFEQYVNLVRKIAEQRPLVIALDDLQWADAASVALLFRLGRRLHDSRILVIGAYRPEEVALPRGGERHPLDKLVSEFQRYFGDVLLDLDQLAGDEGETFVHALLDSEPNRLRSEFRTALLAHTGGHPLFTIELLRAMQERGDLVHDADGYLVVGSQIDWQRLPLRVEGALAERIERLPGTAREMLSVASVQGEEFSAEVIAAVTQAGARDLVRTLSGDLQRVHRLVEHVGVARVGAQRLSSYRFAHNVIQRFFYTGLDEAELAYLHEDIGHALVAVYGAASDQVAVQLAWHFEQAGLAEEARDYLLRAGEQAAARFAYAEAVDFYTRALALGPIDAPEMEFALLRARERAFDVLGERAAQAADLARMAVLAAVLDDGAQAWVALRQGWLALHEGETPAAVAAAGIVTALAADDVVVSAVGSPVDMTVLTGAHLLASQALWQTGQYAAAMAHAEEALSLAREAGLDAFEAQALERLGTIALNQHRTSDALAYHEAALAIAQACGDPRREFSVRNNLGVVAQSKGDHTTARRHYDASLDIARRIGLRQGEGVALGNLGEVYRHLGQYERAVTYTTWALDRACETGDRWGEEILRGNLAEVALQQGEIERARSLADEALAMARELDDWLGQGIAFNVLGACGWRCGDVEAAEAAFAAALVIWDREDEPQRRLESMAGLAATALAADQMERARHHAEVVMEGLVALVDLSAAADALSLSHYAASLAGAEDPLSLDIFAICLDVLERAGDARAAELEARARAVLQARADAITDPQDRLTFLAATPAHRRLMGSAAAMPSSPSAHDLPGVVAPGAA